MVREGPTHPFANTLTHTDGRPTTTSPPIGWNCGSTTGSPTTTGPQTTSDQDPTSTAAPPPPATSTTFVTGDWDPTAGPTTGPAISASGTSGAVSSSSSSATGTAGSSASTTTGSATTGTPIVKGQVLIQIFSNTQYIIDETGTSVSFLIGLDSPPFSSVEIPLSISPSSEARIQPSLVSFSPSGT